MRLLITSPPLLLLIFCFLLHVNTQTVSPSSYTHLTNYATNPYFQVINQTLLKAYSSYLSGTTVSSVYIFNSQPLISLIITYLGASGTSYRATANYSPSTRQLSIQSFGPVAVPRSTTPQTSPNRANTYGNDNGMGITIATPQNTLNLLIPGTNPTISSQNISVLRPNVDSSQPNIFGTVNI